MHAVAELMRERHHVARLALIVEQHVRVRRRHGRMRERAGLLARPRRRIDPVAREEILGDLRHARRERPIGAEHRVLRLAPADRARVDLRQRRVAVPVRQALLAEPLRLQRVIAMRQPRIGVAHRRDQRLDHLRLDAVGQMPRVGDVLEAAPAVGNLLVLGERVGDQREGAQVLLEGLRQRLGRGLALLAVLVLHQRERRLERELLAVDLEAQRRDRLVEQPVPARPRRSPTSRGTAPRRGPRADTASPCARPRSTAGSGRAPDRASRRPAPRRRGG